MNLVTRTATALAFLLASAAAAAAFPATASSSLNIRSGPGANFRIVGSIPAGETVEVTGTSGRWYRISGGWVNGNYLVAGAQSDAYPAYVDYGYDDYGYGAGYPYWGGYWGAGRRYIRYDRRHDRWDRRWDRRHDRWQNGRPMPHREAFRRGDRQVGRPGGVIQTGRASAGGPPRMVSRGPGRGSAGPVWLPGGGGGFRGASMGGGRRGGGGGRFR